jgi:hypothetical protein
MTGVYRADRVRYDEFPDLQHWEVLVFEGETIEGVYSAVGPTAERRARDVAQLMAAGVTFFEAATLARLRAAPYECGEADGARQ